MPFLLDKKVPKDLMDARVPQLIIQTFLENTYKYANRGQGILVFRVEVDSVRQEDQEFLRIHIYDNGGGIGGSQNGVKAKPFKINTTEQPVNYTGLIVHNQNCHCPSSPFVAVG